METKQLSITDEPRQFEFHKANYESPKLIKYGSLAELTGTGSGSIDDSGGFAQRSGIAAF